MRVLPVYWYFERNSEELCSVPVFLTFFYAKNVVYKIALLILFFIFYHYFGQNNDKKWK